MRRLAEIFCGICLVSVQTWSKLKAPAAKLAWGRQVIHCLGNEMWATYWSRNETEDAMEEGLELMMEDWRKLGTKATRNRMAGKDERDEGATIARELRASEANCFRTGYRAFQ
jgi:hypothetical protein